MATFTLRASDSLTDYLSSARMRSWLDDFIRKPHALPLDPGPGDQRVSLTLPQAHVEAVSSHLRCDISSALRRIAVERLGTPRSTAGQLPGVSAPTARMIEREAALDRAAAPQDSPSQVGAIAAVLIPTLLWILIIAACFFLNSRKRKMSKAASQT